MLHQVGISNTVASSGTALTAEHLVKLRRLSNRIIMAYDGDSAGFKASDRSAQLALSLGMELKVAQMPQGKDPADLSREDPEELKKCLKNSKHIIDFYTDSLLAQGLEPRALGQEIKKNVLPYVAMLPSTIEKDHFVKNIAKKTFIKEEALWDDLSKVGSEKTLAETNPVARNMEEGPATRVNSIERRLVGLVLWQEEVSSPVIDALELKEKITNIVGDGMSEIVKSYEKDKNSLLFETENYYNNKTDLETEVSELLKGLEEEYLKRKLTETMILLQKAEQLRDSGLVHRNLEYFKNITKRINDIKNEQK
jgi:DNA primase